MPPHKNDHAYRIMDDLSAPLYTSRWSADEELLLLEGIEQFGLGNWLDIAEHVGTKSRFECEYHYWTVYIDVPSFPVPPSRQSIVDDEKQIRQDDVKKNDDGMLYCVIEREQKLAAKGGAASSVDSLVGGSSSSSSSSSSVTAGATGGGATSVPKKRKLNTKLINMGVELDYMPLRSDFTVEFENEAEDLIAEMEITTNDSEIERQRKLQMLSMYDFILDQREKRKKFALEKGIIIDWKNIMKEDKKRSKAEMELYDKYRRFARFTTLEQFSSLMDSVMEERRIAKRIEQLQNYRRSGIMSLEQGEEKREALASSSSSSSVSGVGGVGSTANKRPLSTTGSGTGSSNVTGPVTSVNALSNSMSRTQFHYVSRSKALTNRYRLDHDATFDIRLYPGAELLSQRERDICTETKLPPRVYMTVKDSLIRESFRLNQMGTFLNKKQACDLICNSGEKHGGSGGSDDDESSSRNMLLSDNAPDRGQISVIYDFCVLSGWVGTIAGQSANSAVMHHHHTN